MTLDTPLLEKNPERPYIISIAGSKGKTTVTRLLAHTFLKRRRNTLHVDTDGHSYNGRQRSTMEGSKKLYGLVPTVSPGRYLRSLKGVRNGVAVIETAIGCANIYGGLGYRFHHIGIFTNVYEDHIGEGIKDRDQLAELKAKYIFRRIYPGGTAIFNADDPYVVDQLFRVPEECTLLPVGIDFSEFDIAKHLKKGGRAVTIKNDVIYTLRGDREFPWLDTKSIPWTFQANFVPSLYNLMFVMGAVFAENDFKMPNRIADRIKSFKLEGGGRLRLLESNKTGIKVLVDYAHEKYSLRKVGQLASKLAEGKTIGIIRLAPDRTDKLLRDTGRYIANNFDVIIVYDKIDGVLRDEVQNVRTGQIRKTGEVSRIVYEAIKKAQSKKHEVHQDIVEADAIAHAFDIAKRGDIIVHIVNDDHKRSESMIKKKLGRFRIKSHT